MFFSFLSFSITLHSHLSSFFFLHLSPLLCPLPSFIPLFPLALNVFQLIPAFTPLSTSSLLSLYFSFPCFVSFLNLHPFLVPPHARFTSIQGHPGANSFSACINTRHVENSLTDSSSRRNYTYMCLGLSGSKVLMNNARKLIIIHVARLSLPASQSVRRGPLPPIPPFFCRAMNHSS